MPQRDDSSPPPSLYDRPLTTPEEPVTAPVAHLPQAANAEVAHVGVPTTLPSRSPDEADTSDHRIGEILLGRYRLDQLVGKGGMGRVYLATQFPLNRPVAVKILSPEFQKKDPQFVRRFYLEAASAAHLSHPNTITVYDYGEAESGELFIAMEYLDGRPLSRVIASEGPLPPRRVLHIGVQIARALREAHTKGIIHRDLKPGNILLLAEGDDADFVKVLDFGLVKLFKPDGEAVDPSDVEAAEREHHDLTEAGMFLGSPKYMSPEQIQGAHLDPRTDIYSLGILMYQMACGRPPFVGTDSVEIIYQQVHCLPPPLVEQGVQVPPEFEAVVHGCLAKHSDDRYESMNVLLGRLREVQHYLFGTAPTAQGSYDLDLSHASQTFSRAALESFSQDAFGATPSLAYQGAPGFGRVVKSHLIRWAPYLATLMLTSVLGAAVYVFRGEWGYSAEPIPAPEAVLVEIPPAQGARELTEVRFSTQPPGARVLEDGVVLGRSPLTHRFPRATDSSSVREITFLLDGYRTETRSVRVLGRTVNVHVDLKLLAPNKPPVLDDRYKENPY